MQSISEAYVPYHKLDQTPMSAHDACLKDPKTENKEMQDLAGPTDIEMPTHRVSSPNGLPSRQKDGLNHCITCMNSPTGSVQHIAHNHITAQSA